jgi:hypothetical protein
MEGKASSATAEGIPMTDGIWRKEKAAKEP